MTGFAQKRSPDLRSLRVRDPRARARRARLRRIMQRVAAAGAAVYLLSVVVSYAYVRYVPPRLPAARQPPLEQPGGSLRQLTAYDDPLFISWSSDGRLAFTLTDLDNQWRMLAGIWAFAHLRCIGLANLLWTGYLTVIAARDGEAAVMRMPGGVTVGTVAWRPRTDTVAVEVARIKFSADYEVEEPQSELWLFDVGKRRLERILAKGASLLPEWAPDGGAILGRTAAGLYPAYSLIDAHTGRQADIPRPPGRRSIGTPRWSPDSRHLAFRCALEVREKQPPRRSWVTDAVWLVNRAAGSGRLIETGHFSTLVWLSDGRLVLIRSSRRGEREPYTRAGAVNLKTGSVEWLPWRLPFDCVSAQEARGGLVCEFAQGVRWRLSNPRDLWELSLADGKARRLTTLGRGFSWRLAPSGDQVAIVAHPRPRASGLWLLDIEPPKG